MKSYWYVNYYKQIYAGSPAYGGWKASGGDTFRIALCPPSYKPNQDTHAVLNDITQVSGQGYTAGGQILTGKTISVATGSLVMEANPATWAGCVFTVRYAVIYDDTNASPLSKQLVRWIDFGQDIQLAGSTLEILFNGQGDVIITPPADVTSPQIADSSVDGPNLTLSYDEQLDTTSVPATSAYTVSVNGSPVAISTTSVSSNKVTMVLAAAVVSADVVTVSYTVPATGMIRDLAFNPAVAFSSMGVSNDTTPPPPPPPPVDVTLPVVAITSPANLATVSSTITVTATATDANGIVSTVLYIDGVSFSTDTSSPYTFGLDTSTLVNGAHTLQAKAKDPAGNEGVSAVVNVTVSNVAPPPPDTTPPSVSITSPLQGAFLAGVFTVAVTATDNVGVVSSTLFVDGVSQGVDASQPYSFSLNTALFSNGIHQLVVTAIDSASNVGTSATITITIDNSVPVFSSASINGASLVLNYNETLNAASVPLTSAFVVKTDGNTRGLSSVSISGIQVLITLSVTVLAANVVTVSYTAGAAPVEDRAGNNAANLTNQAVSNVTPGDATAPTITSLTVNLSSLVIQYSENLDTTSVPATSAFAITVNGTARTVNTVAISSASVTLTLSSAVISSNTVVASYTQPATGKIRDIGQNNAASFFNLPVTNITATPPTDIASFVSQSLAATAMITNATQTVGVTMRNDGTATWTAPSGYHLYSQNPSGNTIWGLSQVSVPGSVLPNGNAPFSFLITAPSTAGTYAFQWRMRHTVTEFGAQSTNQSIVVSNPTQFSAYFVSTTGSDTSPNGSITAPFRTLAKAFSVVQPSGSVEIRGGTYLEGVVNNCPGGTSWTNMVTVRAYQNEPVTLRPSAGANFVIWLQGAAKKYIQFRDLIMDGVNVGSNIIKLDRPVAGTDSANHIRLYNCELKNSKFQALLSVYASDSNEFQRLSIHNCGKTIDSDGLYGYAMYIKGSSNLIEDCDIYDQGSSGIQIFSTTGSTEPPNSNTIRRCKIHNNCVLSSAQGRGAGISIASGTGNQAYNNLVYSNFRGISVGFTFANEILSNTIVSNSDIGLYLEQGGSHQARNNIWYLNGTNFVNTSSGGTVTPNLTSGANPLFADLTNSNFHLLSGSPAINQGVSLATVTTDYDGVARGNPPELGAYEFLAQQGVSVFSFLNFEGATVPKNGDGAFYPNQGTTATGTVSLSTDAKSGSKSLQLLLTASGSLGVQFNPYNYGGQKSGVLSPRGFAREYADNPAGWKFNTYNRFTFWIKSPTNAAPQSTVGGTNLHVGTYVKRVLNPDLNSDEAGGNHYYHHLNLSPTNTWTKVILNMHPNHQRDSGSGGLEWGNSTHPTNEASYNYFDTLTRFYIGIESYIVPLPATYLFDGFEFSQVLGENDDQVYTISATYVPAQNRVILAWCKNKNQSGNHEVRYAFAPITTWAAATAAPSGIITPPSSIGGFNGMVYNTTAMSLAGQSVLYLAIKPTNSSLFSQISIPLT